MLPKFHPRENARFSATPKYAVYGFVPFRTDGLEAARVRISWYAPEEHSETPAERLSACTRLLPSGLANRSKTRSCTSSSHTAPIHPSWRLRVISKAWVDALAAKNSELMSHTIPSMVIRIDSRCCCSTCWPATHVQPNATDATRAHVARIAVAVWVRRPPTGGNRFPCTGGTGRHMKTPPPPRVWFLF